MTPAPTQEEAPQRPPHGLPPPAKADVRLSVPEPSWLVPPRGLTAAKQRPIEPDSAPPHQPGNIVPRDPSIRDRADTNAYDRLHRRPRLSSWAGSPDGLEGPTGGLNSSGYPDEAADQWALSDRGERAKELGSRCPAATRRANRPPLDPDRQHEAACVAYSVEARSFVRSRP